MGKYVTVSAKVSKELKDRLYELDVNVSRFVRNAIEKEVSRREEEKLRMVAGKASHLLRKIPADEIVKVVRKTRDEQ